MRREKAKSYEPPGRRRGPGRDPYDLGTIPPRHYNHTARITFVALPDRTRAPASESRSPHKGWTRKRGPVNTEAP